MHIRVNGISILVISDVMEVSDVSCIMYDAAKNADLQHL